MSWSLREKVTTPDEVSASEEPDPFDVCEGLLNAEVDSFELRGPLKWLRASPTEKDVLCVEIYKSDEYRNNLKRGDHISFKLKKLNPSWKMNPWWNHAIILQTYDEAMIVAMPCTVDDFEQPILTESDLFEITDWFKTVHTKEKRLEVQKALIFYDQLHRLNRHDHKNPLDIDRTVERAQSLVGDGTSWDFDEKTSEHFAIWAKRENAEHFATWASKRKEEPDPFVWLREKMPGSLHEKVTSPDKVSLCEEPDLFVWLRETISGSMQDLIGWLREKKSDICEGLLNAEVDSFGEVPLREVFEPLKWLRASPTEKDVLCVKIKSDKYRNNLKRGDHISFKLKKLNPSWKMNPWWNHAIILQTYDEAMIVAMPCTVDDFEQPILTESDLFEITDWFKTVHTKEKRLEVQKALIFYDQLHRLNRHDHKNPLDIDRTVERAQSLVGDETSWDYDEKTSELFAIWAKRENAEDFATWASKRKDFQETSSQESSPQDKSPQRKVATQGEALVLDAATMAVNRGSNGVLAIVKGLLKTLAQESSDEVVGVVLGCLSKATVRVTAIFAAASIVIDVIEFAVFVARAVKRYRHGKISTKKELALIISKRAVELLTSGVGIVVSAVVSAIVGTMLGGPAGTVVGILVGLGISLLAWGIGKLLSKAWQKWLFDKMFDVCCTAKTLCKSVFNRIISLVRSVIPTIA